MHVEDLNADDQAWVYDFMLDQWGSTVMVSRGKRYEIDKMAGLRVEKRGLLTYDIQGDQFEVVLLSSSESGKGIGRALLDAAQVKAREAGCHRFWLITTNDNTPALRFYQKYGFRLAALHKNAIAESRRIKPQIPELGLDDIPIRDEIELEIPLD